MVEERKGEHFRRISSIVVEMGTGNISLPVGFIVLVIFIIVAFVIVSIISVGISVALPRSFPIISSVYWGRTRWLTSTSRK